MLGDSVAKLRTDLMTEQLATFRSQLEDFAHKHKNDIRKNPTFRSQFHEMCAKVGVDPLASNKGFWAELLGIGDFYYELDRNDVLGDKGSENSIKDSIKGQGSPLRRTISRRERSPVQHWSSKAENASGHMDTDSESRLKSFVGQLLTERGILERIVYKHKNQHRRCTYFQYLLKVRRDLNLLKSVKLEEILDASFLVINGNKPKQKLQLLESLKRRRCDGGKYNILERLLGAARLLSEMVEPLLRAAMEISTLLAQSFFMKFSLTTLAVLARVRVLVQQILIDAVLVYNCVSTLSQREHTIKLNQEGFEVFREYYPRKMEDTVTLDCIWQIDKYVLVERTVESESKNQERGGREDVLIQPSNIQYDNVEAFLEDESDPIDVKLVSAEAIDGEESSLNHLGKHVRNDSHSAGSLCSHKSETCDDNLMEYGSSAAICSTTPLVKPVKQKGPTKKNVAFVSVNLMRTPSTANQSMAQLSLIGSELIGEDSFWKPQE